MIKYLLEDSKSKERDKEIILELVYGSSDCVMVKAKGYCAGALVSFNPDGTIYLHSAVSREIGFQLDDNGKIKVEEARCAKKD